MCNAFTSTQGPMHLWGGRSAVMLAKYISHLQRYFHTTFYIYWQGREGTRFLCLFQQNPRTWVQVRALENLGFGGQFLTYYSYPGMNIFFSLSCVYSVIGGNGIVTVLQKVDYSIIILRGMCYMNRLYHLTTNNSTGLMGGQAPSTMAAFFM